LEEIPILLRKMVFNTPGLGTISYTDGYLHNASSSLSR
jgi:hypothetical protein